MNEPDVGMIARSSARLGAVQALYQMDVAQTPVTEVLAEFETHRLGNAFENGECGQADIGFLKNLVQGVVSDQKLIDRRISDKLASGWTLSRLDLTVRAVLRAAVYEICFREDVPPKVIISEYVEIAGCFFGSEEVAFVNALLDGLARDSRPEDFAQRADA